MTSKNSREAILELREGDLIRAKERLSEKMIDYRFIRLSGVADTCLGERLSDGREIWLTYSQIEITGERAPERESDDQGERKPTRWTIGDPIPEHLIKKRSRKK